MCVVVAGSGCYLMPPPSPGVRAARVPCLRTEQPAAPAALGWHLPGGVPFRAALLSPKQVWRPLHAHPAPPAHGPFCQAFGLISSSPCKMRGPLEGTAHHALPLPVEQDEPSLGQGPMWDLCGPCWTQERCLHSWLMASLLPHAGCPSPSASPTLTWPGTALSSSWTVAFVL